MARSHSASTCGSNCRSFAAKTRLPALLQLPEGRLDRFFVLGRRDGRVLLRDELKKFSGLHALLLDISPAEQLVKIFSTASSNDGDNDKGCHTHDPDRDEDIAGITRSLRTSAR